MINKPSLNWCGITVIILQLLIFGNSARADQIPKVGVILPATGRFADIAASMQVAIETAAQNLPTKIRSSFDLQFVDNYGQPDSARAVAQRLAQQSDVCAFLAGYPSECAREVAKVAEREAVPYLIISSSADSLTINSGDYTFRLAPPTSDYNDGLVGWAATVVGSKRRISVVWDDDPRSSGALTDIRMDLSSRWQGDVDYHLFETGERDFAVVLEELKKSDPTLVWLIGSTFDIARFLKQCRDFRWSPAAFALGTVGLVNPDLILAADGAADYIFAPVIWWQTPPYPEVDSFVENYESKLGEKPDYHAAEAYAGLQVMASAFQNTGVQDREMLRSALEMSNVLTVFGRIKFEDYRHFNHQNRVLTGTVQLHGNEWRMVWPLELAQTGFIYPAPDWDERERESPAIMQNSWFLILMVLVTGILLYTAVIRRRDLIKRMEK